MPKIWAGCRAKMRNLADGGAGGGFGILAYVRQNAPFNWLAKFLLGRFCYGLVRANS